MTIHVNEANLIFHLQTDHTSYIFQIMENGEAGQIYYGRKIHVQPAYQNLTSKEWRDDNPSLSEAAPNFQPAAIKAEYSSLGKGDFRYPAFQITQKNGSRITELQYDHYQLSAGKKRLAGLPSTFDDTDDDAQTLIISFKDQITGLTVDLNYSLFPHQDVIVRSTTFTNPSSEKLVIDRALSSQLDLPDDNYDLIQFSGTWAKERHLYRNHLRPGIQSISSLRTSSSHQQNPFMILVRPETTDQQGAAFGFNLVYSGNFLDSIEVDQYNTSRILTGINPDEFGWQLGPGASFQTPEAVLSYTSNGMNQLSQQLADFYSQHLVNPRFTHQDRPILINNWEATYFDFDEAKLMTIVNQAHQLGIEMFVLDDGWFGHRDDDTTSLGDWFVDKKKFPNGIEHFSQQVHELGMKFGLWFEPEMISIDSDLYRKHPDWMIHDPKSTPTPGRHQFVLDMTRQDVIDYLYDRISHMIESAKLDYIKWDMNRHITEMFSSQLTAAQQLEMPHRYILGVYQLYDRLTKAYPDVLFESCASGGGRFDLGLMYYAPQAWTSDDTDAAERMLIQFGTSYGYPQSMMGAHVSAVPNDQVGRVTSLKTRGAVALFGDFGYELDITKMSPTELTQIKEQVAFYKQHRHLLQFGKFYRLDSPFVGKGNVISWQVVSNDQKQAIAARYQLLNQPNPPYTRFYFTGLDPDREYRVNDDSETYYGDELMNAGYFVPTIKPNGETSQDFNAQLFIVKAV
ncbi:alpha-galactosidase [Lentilactobacillus farraginis]|uniref:Alpha-galactosidase n=2 Tax=Lentilactobacillus farraginis DSM 18382 = JCM 14108 TaxID=1423743 RepID=A0A0R1VTC8_9LACO|nr:alpha-galactosidase [Lentilactobacillus farraginis]KRM08970.1 alpha-galactosidase [Lentilactobacillus farraginis DSM 18382 = JCM 14108]